MQEALACLDDYWTKQGCVKLQPMNTEVGAGTMSPATFLRVLGPEPWHVAYAEPSVRPDDSRNGKNPNRIQTHTQYQVILKPEPGDPQELYLGSLEALGIDVRAHDIRFVEDNWASPALGAWGQGWEVWLDGLEITQFTYFQQAGGIVLDPVSVELTYGMERIMMALQDVRHFKEISYTDSLSYGELYGQAEYEMSRYYLDEADVAANRQLLTIYAGEARRLIAAGLPIPAYSYVLKCSHTFNVLDARGSVSTAERAAMFAQMRELSGDVARLWISTRAGQGPPPGIVAPLDPAVPASLPELSPASRPRDFALQVGTEEIRRRRIAALGQEHALARSGAVVQPPDPLDPGPLGRPGDPGLGRGPHRGQVNPPAADGGQAAGRSAGGRDAARPAQPAQPGGPHHRSGPAPGAHRDQLEPAGGVSRRDGRPSRRGAARRSADVPDRGAERDPRAV